MNAGMTDGEAARRSTPGPAFARRRSIMHKVIKTYEDLLDWAKRANQCLDLKEKIALQDEMGHSIALDLDNAFSEAVKKIDRNLIAFAILKVTNPDYLETFFAAWAKRHAIHWQQFYEKEFLERLSALNTREIAILDARKSLAKKFRKFTERIHLLENKNRSLTIQGELLITHNDQLAEKAAIASQNADKWTQFKTLMED